MKKLIITFFLFFILFEAAHAHKSHGSRLSLRDPQTFNGTYRIERFILREKDNTLLDSDNEFQVYDDKGIATIILKLSKSQLQAEFIYKMEMVGPAFDTEALKDYRFIYKKKVFTTDMQKFDSLSAALQNIGVTVYGSHELLWQLPFEKGKTVTIKLNKKRDIAMPLDNIPFSERKKNRQKHKRDEMQKSEESLNM